MAQLSADVVCLNFMTRTLRIARAPGDTRCMSDLRVSRTGRSGEPQTCPRLPLPLQGERLSHRLTAVTAPTSSAARRGEVDHTLVRLETDVGELQGADLDRERCSGHDMLEPWSGPLGRTIEGLRLLSVESGSGRWAIVTAR